MSWILAVVALLAIAIAAVIGIIGIRVYVAHLAEQNLRSDVHAMVSSLTAVGGLTIDEDALDGLLRQQGEGGVLVADGHAFRWRGVTGADANRLARAAADKQLSAPIRFDRHFYAYAVDVTGKSFTVVRTDGTRTDVDTIIVTISTQRDDRIVTALVAANCIGGAAGFTALLIAALIAVGRQLRPLSRMADRAAQLVAGDETARLPLSGSDPAIDRLAHTVNDAFDAQQDAQQRMRSFVSDAGHELRTPLTVAAGWVELDLNGGLTDPAARRHALQRVNTQLSRMRLLIDDLTVLARTDEGLPMATEPVDLAELARDEVDDARVAAPDRAITLTVAQSPAITIGDLPRLGQAVRNLLTNAIAHTPETAFVRVIVRSEARPGWHQIIVEDDGPGIRPENLPHVFERFWRADAARQKPLWTDGHGSGLGLSIAQAIIAHHHGRLTVTSTFGAGSVFTIELAAQ